MMAYFENLTRAQFKQARDGSWLYFPHGFLGNGRRIDSEAEKQRLYASHKRMLKILLPVSILGGLVTGLAGMPPALLATLLLFIALVGVNHWRKYCHLPHAIERMDFREASGRASKALPGWYPWMVGYVSLGVIVTALALPMISDRPFGELKMLVAMGLGMGGIGIFIAVLVHRIKRRVHEEAE